MPLPRRLTAVALAAVLVACGSDAASDATDAASSSGSASASAVGPAEDAAPITFEHRFGTTAIEEPPERIVSLDLQWTDVLVELDAPLVGAASDPYGGGYYPWQELPEDVEELKIDSATIPFEAVAALQPDLIVTSWAAADQSTYDRLAEIAPTIPLLSDEEVDAWQDIATAAGRVLDAEDEAAQLVADGDQVAADLLAELPGLEGKTYALANYVAGDGIYVVADADDGAGILFGQLGLEIDPELLALADGATGRLELSLEQISQLDADLLILLTNGTEVDSITGYASLPAVESGAVSVLDTADITGLNTPTPISIPYALGKIRPALEAAAG